MAIYKTKPKPNQKIASKPSKSSKGKNQADVQLAIELAKYYDDPYGFVLFAFPWGKKGTPLERFSGPDEWQRKELEKIGGLVRKNGFDGRKAVRAIKRAISSGHGIGKSALISWLVCWIMSTRPFSQGTVTANTAPQLESKTWAQIAKWLKMCITNHWFTITTGRGSMKMYHNQHPESWFCSAQTCKEENSESFAGQHAATSTSFYLFDESSAVPDSIWEVAEGGLTDGEPMFFVYGNPTKNSGKFFRIMFGSERGGSWGTTTIDSRDCMLPNKDLIDEWIEEHGLESDFIRVRVLGLAPSASEIQFIDRVRVEHAQKREALSLPTDPLILGIDVARGGADYNVIQFRKGLDARSIPAIKIAGEDTRDSMVMVHKIIQVISDGYMGMKPDAVFLDATGIGGPIADRCRQMGFNVVDVQFGGKSPMAQYANMRAYMWGQMKEWLLKGAIPKDIVLEMDLLGPEYAHNNRDRIVLESKESMKKRGVDSPDWGDALALTFAYPVNMASSLDGRSGPETNMLTEFDPYA